MIGEAPWYDPGSKEEIRVMRLSIHPSRPAGALALAVAACVLSLTAACAKQQPSGPRPTHKGVGVVVAVDVAKSRVKINHENIEGWMDAMTMWFDVKEAKMLDGISPNDRVEFVVTEEESADVITELRKTS